MQTVYDFLKTISFITVKSPFFIIDLASVYCKKKFLLQLKQTKRQDICTMFRAYLSRHCSYNDKINQIIRPLSAAFPFTHIWYYSITSEGHYTCIGSRQDWTEYFFYTEVYKNISSFFRHPRYFRSSNMIFKVDKEIADRDQPCHINSSLVIVEKNKNGMEGFGFGSDLTNNTIDHIYLNELGLLRKFRDFFKKEAKSLILAEEANPLSLKEMIGAAVFDSAPPLPQIEDRARNQLLRYLGLQAPPRLSPRESWCLALTLQGKSAGRIAKELEISLRTVEYYIENVKNKFGCNLKVELFERALQLKELGVIDCPPPP
jgi:DNA-binding CsgD family transcriptional regulator